VNEQLNPPLAAIPREARYKAQAEHYLAETRRILRELAAERERDKARHVNRSNIVEEVKAILRGA
jgi:thermostable 8-oxoguanine DNA glycosylase